MTPIPTSQLDAGDDSPKLARGSLLLAVQAINQISSVTDLDTDPASALIARPIKVTGGVAALAGTPRLASTSGVYAGVDSASHADITLADSTAAANNRAARIYTTNGGALNLGFSSDDFTAVTPFLTATRNANVTTALSLAATAITLTATTISLVGALTAGAVTATSFSGAHVGDGSGLINLSASQLTSGTVSPARLGSGSPSATTYLAGDGTWKTTPVGTVTAVSVATANGVSGTSSGGATPALTIVLGAITPTSVAATGGLSGTTLATSAQVTMTGTNAVVSQLASVAAYGGFQVSDTSPTRQFEFLWLGTGKAASYGAPSGTAVINASTSSITFSTSDVARMVIAATGAVTVNGAFTTNGLMTAAGGLAVNGSSSVAGAFSATSMTIANNQSYNILSSGGAVNSCMQLDATNNLQFGNGGATVTQQWATGGVTRMWLSSGGLLGLGTSAPVASLEVMGNIASRDTKVASTAANSRWFGGAYSGNLFTLAYLLGNSTGNQVTIGGGTSGGEAATIISFNTTAAVGTTGVGTERMRITNTGLVMVGAIASMPSTPVTLSVQNSMAVTATSGIQYLLMGNQDSAGANLPTVIGAANGNFYVGTGSPWANPTSTVTTNFTMSSSGVMLVGAAAQISNEKFLFNQTAAGNTGPGMRLHNTATTVGTGNSLAFSSMTGSSSVATNNAIISASAVDVAGNGSLSFATGTNGTATNKLSIDNLGQVGIGIPVASMNSGTGITAQNGTLQLYAASSSSSGSTALSISSSNGYYAALKIKTGPTTQINGSCDYFDITTRPGASSGGTTGIGTGPDSVMIRLEHALSKATPNVIVKPNNDGALLVGQSTAVQGIITANGTIASVDASLTYIASMTGTPTGSVISAFSPTGQILIFQTTASGAGATEHMRIDGQGVTTITSSGTALVGNSSAVATYGTSSNDAAQIATFNNTTVSTANGSPSADSRIMAVAGFSNGLALLRNASGGGIVFGIGNNEVVRFDKSNNMGIGGPVSTWWSGRRGIQIQATNGTAAGDASFTMSPGTQNFMSIQSNVYVDASQVARYVAAGSATQYSQSAGVHAWLTAPVGAANAVCSASQLMTLDASGALMIGTTNNVNAAKVLIAASGPGLQVTGNTTTSASSDILITRTGATEVSTPGNGCSIQLQNSTNTTACSIQHYSNNLQFMNYTSGTWAERMRIDSAGNVLVGTSSNATSTGTNCIQLLHVNTGDFINVSHANNTATGISYLYFTYAGTLIGNVVQNGTTGVLYNTTSDYRLKNIIGPIKTSGAFIDALQPKYGTWKADGSPFAGFLAHEVQYVSPSSVSGEKDEVDDDGKAVLQSMDAASPEIMANVVAELQAVRKRLADAEAKNAAYETQFADVLSRLSKLESA